MGLTPTIRVSLRRRRLPRTTLTLASDVTISKPEEENIWTDELRNQLNVKDNWIMTNGKTVSLIHNDTGKLTLSCGGISFLPDGFFFNHNSEFNRADEQLQVTLVVAKALNWCSFLRDQDVPLNWVSFTVQDTKEALAGLENVG